MDVIGYLIGIAGILIGAAVALIVYTRGARDLKEASADLKAESLALRQQVKLVITFLEVQKSNPTVIRDGAGEPKTIGVPLEGSTSAMFGARGTLTAQAPAIDPSHFSPNAP